MRPGPGSSKQKGKGGGRGLAEMPSYKSRRGGARALELARCAGMQLKRVRLVWESY